MTDINTGDQPDADDKFAEEILEGARRSQREAEASLMTEESVESEIQCMSDEKSGRKPTTAEVRALLSKVALVSNDKKRRDLFTTAKLNLKGGFKQMVSDANRNAKDDWAGRRAEDVRKARATKVENNEEGVRYEFDNEDDCVDAINEVAAFIRLGNKRRVVYWDKEGAPYLLDKRDAELELAPYRYVCMDGETVSEISGYKLWLKSPRRVVYDGVGFYPDPSKTPVGYLNLFTGFAVKPAPGDWGLLRNHIKDQICSGSVDQFEYILDILSQLFFEPGVKSGIITAIRGLPGTGKSKLGEWVCKIIGPRHSIVIGNGDQVTGRFNGHLELMLFILAEEAFFAGDPKAGKALKLMATGENYTYESKGVDARGGVNYVRVMMPTNENWVAPVEAFDRRYLVTDCSPARREDKPFFASIDDQMEAGGAAAMLHELLERKMTFRKLGKPPMTEAKKEQIRESMTPKMKWLASVLQDGQFMYKEKGEPASTEWPEHGGAVEKSAMLSSYQFLVPGYRGPASPEELGIFLKKQFPTLAVTKRAKFAGGQRDVLPSLADARATFILTNPDHEFEVEVSDVPDAKQAANDATTDQQRAN